MKKLLTVSAVLVISVLFSAMPVMAHLHPLVPVDCANGDGAGNTAEAFFTAPGVQAHWDIVDLLPGVPGIQFLVPLSNPGKAGGSSGAVGFPAIFEGPGVDPATSNCANA